MAPIDNLPLNILARILQFGSALPYGGPPREDYYDRAPYEVVRADFLRQTSLVNKTFRKQAQLLLFSRPFFRSVADFSTFRVVVQQYGRANQVRGVVFILESGKSAHLKWKRAIVQLLQDFPTINWIECQTGKAQEKIDLSWFAPVAGNLRYLRLRHHSVESPSIGSELSFPNLDHLDLEGCKLLSLEKKDCTPFFSLFPRLTKLEWKTCPFFTKAGLTKLKKGLKPVSATLRSFTIDLWEAVHEDAACAQLLSDILSSLTQLTFLHVSLDCLTGNPTLSLSLHTIVLERTYKSAEFRTQIECDGLREMLPRLPNLQLIDGLYLWRREAKKGQREQIAYEALQRTCDEKGTTLFVSDLGFDSSEDGFAAHYAWQQMLPENVGPEYDLTADEERKLNKAGTMMHFSKILQRTFLQGSVVEQELDRCGVYLTWLCGCSLSCFDLDSKIGYVLRRISRLPDGYIPQWAEDKYWFRRVAGAVHRICDDAVKDPQDGEKES